jgi:hypothetical protein
MTTSLPPLQLRPYAAPGDEPLVYSSWIRQVADLPPLAGTDPREHRDVIGALLARSLVLVACNPACPDQVYGYVCAEPPDALHFVYVRNTWRRFGIGSLLVGQILPGFKQDTTYVTHATRALRHLRGPWRLVFNPYKVLH